MKKAYIQPEVELLSLASLEDFLEASPVTSDETVGDNENWNNADNDDFGNTDKWK